MVCHMPDSSPLRSIQESAGAAFLPYGPSDAGVEVVESFGEFEAEYAAIRRGAAVMEMPQRSLVEVTGADRLEFLHRFLTHDTVSLGDGEGRRAFLLSRQGRVEADMVVLQNQDRTLLAIDRFQAAHVTAELNNFLFSEDVQLADHGDRIVHITLHGPQAAALIGAAATGTDSDGAAALKSLHHCPVEIAAQRCVVYRLDETGESGLHLLVPSAEAPGVYQALADAAGGLVPDVEGGVRRAIQGRGIGWLAYNTARIEAGTPIFHVDYGPDSLPHETGLLDQAVNFTKGCYVGQEVVARMQNLGHPKRLLVGVRFEDDHLPVAGSPMFEPDESRKAIGAVTSSTLSPMLGNVAIGFAMVRWGKHQKGTAVAVHADGNVVEGTVQELTFLH